MFMLRAPQAGRACLDERGVIFEERGARRSTPCLRACHQPDGRGAVGAALSGLAGDKNVAQATYVLSVCSTGNAMPASAG